MNMRENQQLSYDTFNRSDVTSENPNNDSKVFGLNSQAILVPFSQTENTRYKMYLGRQ